jgi:S-adenosylmethionine hydrolase
MPVITITSDWGHRDPYLASVKGNLLAQLPDASIVDISHDITPFDLNQASFIIKNAFRSFPEGSVHLIGINTEASINTPHTVVFADGHYFIGADNGIFPLILDNPPEKIIELEIFQETDYFTFPARDVFIKAAVHLAEGGDIEKLGAEKNKLNELISFMPVIESNVIRGKVIYIDAYENIITNITETLFRDTGKGNPFVITFRTPGYAIHNINKSYGDVPEGEMLALFGSAGNLEIAMNRGNASSLLGMDIDDTVRIEFNTPG